MRYMNFILFSAIFLLGCVSAKPIAFEIEAPTPYGVPARVQFQLLEGDPQQVIPESCAAPCTITVHPGSSYVMTVNAEGYFPAEINFDYGMVWRTSSVVGKASKETRLVVPLIKIPDEATDTATDDRTEAEVSGENEPVNDGAP